MLAFGGLLHIIGIIICSILFFCVGFRLSFGKDWRTKIDFAQITVYQKTDLFLVLPTSILLAIIWPFTLSILILVAIMYLLFKLIILILCHIQKVNKTDAN